MVNDAKSCSVWPKIPNTDAIFSWPWKIFCAGFDATTRLKFLHLSMSGANRLAKLSGIPSELMLIVNIELL